MLTAAATHKDDFVNETVFCTVLDSGVLFTTLSLPHWCPHWCPPPTHRMPGAQSISYANAGVIGGCGVIAAVVAWLAGTSLLLVLLGR